MKIIIYKTKTFLLWSDMLPHPLPFKAAVIAEEKTKLGCVQNVYVYNLGDCPKKMQQC